MTMKQKEQILKHNLSTNKKWAVRACVRIHDKQTMEEQAQGQTIAENGQGFAKPDSEILSSFSVQIKAGREMSPKQTNLIFRLIPKYWGQILPSIPQDYWERLEGLEGETTMNPEKL